MAPATTKKCFFVQATKRDKTPGRPAQRYTLPETAYLCNLMNVDNIGSDPITLADIQSTPTYRAALNRELIKRRPSKYSQTWLGYRMNVSERTLQRYLKRENIQSRQMLEEVRIDWSNLNQIPTAEGARRAGFNMQPYFLQDETGKRYPPKPAIARKLLKQGHGVWLMKRSVNLYWYGSEPVPRIPMQPEAKSGSVDSVATKLDYQVQNEMVVPVQSMPMQPEFDVAEMVPFPHSTAPQQQVPTQRKRSSRFYKQPLPDGADEWLAQKVYLATGNLQEIEARQLVDKYGRKAVGQALGRMEFMREKGELQNPAGFMKVASRVCWFAVNGFNTPKPEYQSPKKRKPRKTAYHPIQDPIWQSESYREWRLSFKDAPIDIWEMPCFRHTIVY